MAFVKVAAVEQVPQGASRVVFVNGHELGLFNIEGEFFCIDNFCPHSGGPLGDGYLDKDVVMCPWHGWQFNVRTGAMPYTPSVCVATFVCKVEGEDVLVDL